MSADWSKPAVGDTYANFLSYLNQRLNDAAQQFDSALATPTNQPVGTIRWNSSASNWERWNGSAWAAAAATYAINISGNAATASTAAACSGNAATATVAASCSGNAATASTASACTGNAATVTGISNGYAPSDLNNAITSGFYRFGMTEANRPTDFGQLLVIHGGADTITQIVGNYGNGNIHTRSGNPPSVGGTGTWTTWRTLVSSANIGTGLSWDGTNLNCTVSSPVSSVGGNTGAVSNAQIAASATAGYGYTPANGASYVARDNNSVIGMTVWATTNSSCAPGATITGTQLMWLDGDGAGTSWWVQSYNATGTWRNVGWNTTSGNSVSSMSLFQRIA